MEVTLEYTEAELANIIEEAMTAARNASQKFFDEQMGGQDAYACGFAWVNIYKFNGVAIKGNTKLGRMLKKLGVDQDYTKAFQIWNPSGMYVQNIDTKEVGAQAAANVFRRYGFTAYACSRLD